MNEPPVYFVHIADTHIGSTRGEMIYDRNPYACAEAVLEAITRLPITPDFIVHTGDIVDKPETEAYRLAAGLFCTAKIPVYYVTGNHDTAELISGHLAIGPTARRSEHPSSLCYAFECKGHKFVVLDARGPDEIEPSGLIPQGQIEFLTRELGSDKSPVSVFVHFPPLPLDSRWLDERMLIRNGDQLHDTLLPVRERIRGVFYGHVHRGIQQVKDGILYSSVASSFRQFSTFPSDDRPTLDQGLPAFNLVTLFPDRVIIKEHSVVTDRARSRALSESE